MPIYFDKSSLTPEQLARWDWAMAEYGRVQESNIQRTLSAMINHDKAKYLAAIRAPLVFAWASAESDEEESLAAQAARLAECQAFVNADSQAASSEILAHMRRSLGGMSGGGAGHPKSALFQRLLDGQQALPYPPPTSHSYPWYEVIEEPGPFSVLLGGAMTLGSMARGTRGATGEFAIVINQCAWAVQSMNDSAKELFYLDDELKKTRRKEQNGPHPHQVDTYYEWTPDFYRRVVACYRRLPEFVVQHGDWPAYRLALGQEETNCRRDMVEDAIAGVNLDKHLCHMSSVFDEHSLYLNAVIGKTTEKSEHPKVRLQKAQERVAKLRQAATAGEHVDSYSSLDNALIEQQLANLEREVAAFEARPNAYDRVDVTRDRWMLYKVSTAC